jgi:hypothetical protein
MITWTVTPLKNHPYDYRVDGSNGLFYLTRDLAKTKSFIVANHPGSVVL